MNPPSTVPVLMYHATPGIRPDGPGGYDPHYAVPLESFARQMTLARAAGVPPRHVLAVAESGGCGVTFDDGHATNADAARVLAEHGGTADFFLNTSTLGTAGCLDWSDVREMAALGMSIQSHGHTHRYFDELSPTEIRTELARSKAEIEQAIGRAVVLFAPPGGRLGPDVPAIAAELGYVGICSSRAGLWRPSVGPGDVPRLAVLASTSDGRLERWLRADPDEIARMQARKQVLDFGKRLLGNRLYDRLREALVGGGGSAR